jgi:sugar phosphate isomerase/epimerase
MRSRRLIGPTDLLPRRQVAFVLAAALVGAVAGCAHTKGAPPAPAATRTTAAAGKIMIGQCAGIKDLEKAKAAGFEFVELGVRNFANLPEAELEQALATHRRVGLPTPVANVFLPGDLKVVGPDIDRAKQMSYVERALSRAARFGIKIVVFGSGGSRKVPDGFPRDEAWKQLVDFGKRIAPVAQKNGIVIAVEPLQKKETNIINTAAEGLAWVRAVDHPNLQLMVDFFHLALEQEDPSILVEAKDHIRHFHIANPNGRVYPLDAKEYDYAGFFANLKQMGFEGGISVEASAKDYAKDAPRAIAFIREQLAAPPATP